MKKKILAIVLCVAMLAIAIVGGTMAYFTDTEGVTNVMTTGNFAAFIWFVPCFIPTFIGSLFLMPYQEAAYAAFYRDISGTTPVTPDPVQPVNNCVWDER